MNVETIGYDDSGNVDAETIITLDETELVIVEYESDSKHSVFERDIGNEEPHSKLA